MQILFIHGRAQEDFTQEKLLHKWTVAFKLSFENAGINYPEGLSLNLPYYGKELIEQRNRYSQAIKDKEYQMRSPNDADDFNEFQNFQQRLLSDLGKNAEITPEEIHEQEQAEAQERGYRNWGISLAIARLIDNRRNTKGVANKMILKETADVATYLIVRDAKNIINKYFIDALTQEPTIIIAHSLGTIIGYEILQELKKDQWDIRGLITLGSPLGVNAITRQLYCAPKFPSVLKGIWVNIYDKHDIVSLRPLEGGHFRVCPEIINHEIVNETKDRHGIEGYLSSHYVAAAISDILTSNK